AFYNVFLHPLRNFPGPRLWAAFRLPQVLCRLMGKRAFKMLELHEKYGDIVRIGPDQLSIVKSEAWKQIYSYDHGKYTFKKHPRMYSSWEESHNIVDAAGKNHARVRRALLPAFTDKSIKEMEPLIQKNVDHLIEYLSSAQRSKEKPEMCSVYAFTTTDIITDIASLQRPYLLDTLDRSQVIFATWTEYWLLQLVCAFRYWPTADFFFRRLVLTPVLFFLMSGKMSLDSLSKEQSGKERTDLWSLAQKDENGDVNLSPAEIHGNGEILTIAGAETTSTTISALTWYALKAPDKMAKLTAEIRTAFERPEGITLNSVQSLPYLNAGLREALRLHPAVAGNLLRITPKNGATVCGETLPGGIEISMPPYAMGHIPSYWQDVDKFIPERWIDPLNSPYASDRRDASQPFSLGPQSCIGERLAWHQARLILTKMFWHFDFVLCDDKQNWPNQNEMIGWRRNALNVEVHRRP
ncbi:cytochrome P450, partial [Rhizodiscina lignyota]